MLTTDYVPGSPNWIDLNTTDLEAAAEFYGSLLGWAFQSAGPDAGGYGFLQLGGKTVAALGPVDDGQAPTWTIYFMTPDAEATGKSVEQAGGTLRVPAFDVFAAGRMASCTDPGGADFSVWQPGLTVGLDVVTDPGSLTWAELYVPEPDAVRPFYRDVFGWTFEDMPFGDMTYIVASTAGGQNPGLGGIMPLQPGDTPHWLPYFEVPDCDATLARAQQLGGRVLSPVMGAEGVGRFAEIADPQGVRFAVITSAAS
jgi:predicted enzyme related to lactoylglutathione lyase